MKLNELIEILNGFKDEGHGDVDICVEADHGQIVSSAYMASVEDYCNDEGMLVHPDDLEDYEGIDLEKIVLISG